MTKKPKADYAIQAVANALRLLHVFRDEDEIGVAELARRLDLPKNNVFRLLATMVEYEFIEQCKVTGRYRLGLECHALGQGFRRARPLLERARPILDKLLEDTGETVHLAVRDGFEVVHLKARAPAREIAIGVRTGRRAPVHCTGEPAFAILKETFGDRYIYAGLGTTVLLGPKVTVKAEAGLPNKEAMDEEYLRSYREAMMRGPLRALLGGDRRLAQSRQ